VRDWPFNQLPGRLHGSRIPKQRDTEEFLMKTTMIDRDGLSETRR
jgi:hypothetical protein